MIVYDLQCEFDHCFEGWFKDAGDFDKQLASGYLQCPVCNSANVIRVPSASRINLGSKQPESGGNLQPAVNQYANQVMGKLQQYIQKNFDNVGDTFPSLARQMHYGEVEQRNIRGTATLQEAQSLLDEGIDLVRLPDDKPDKSHLN